VKDFAVRQMPARIDLSPISADLFGLRERNPNRSADMGTSKSGSATIKSAPKPSRSMVHHH